ncbi:hypothetical protein C7212DRAFT_344338 [Tuber magnatum]|uniref:Myb-like domain-containing protein n=1 Tax=Tuber magnatum TaxID=42249 RepID=A0A317SNC2_9PEZI|nr:hypothetical protein C7212DRAFT_344338 [Tuber magnatum]
MENSPTPPYPHPAHEWSQYVFPPVQQPAPFSNSSLEQIDLSYTYPHLQNFDPWELLPFGCEASRPGYECENVVSTPHVLRRKTLIYGMQENIGILSVPSRRLVGDEFSEIVGTFTSGLHPPVDGAEHRSSNPSDRGSIPGIDFRHTLYFLGLRRLIQLLFRAREPRGNPAAHVLPAASFTLNTPIPTVPPAGTGTANATTATPPTAAIAITITSSSYQKTSTNHSQQLSRLPTTSHTTQNALLLHWRSQGISYKTIRTRLNLTEAESTLRGRLRTLTKPKCERLRRPQWLPEDVGFLIRAVEGERGDGKGGIKWKRVSEEIVRLGGKYRFGPSTCKKRYLALVGEGVVRGLEGVETGNLGKRRRRRKENDYVEGGCKGGGRGG